MSSNLPPSGGSNIGLGGLINFDTTSQEDEKVRFFGNPQVQDGWRSISLYSFRTDKLREFGYWVRQIIAIKPSLLGVVQSLGAVFYGAVPKWLVWGIWTSVSSPLVPCILVGGFFVIAYGTILALSITQRELRIPAIAKFSMGALGLLI